MAIDADLRVLFEELAAEDAKSKPAFAAMRGRVEGGRASVLLIGLEHLGHVELGATARILTFVFGEEGRVDGRL